MIQKQASARGKSVKVTFELPSEAAQESVSVVGDFNAWDAEKDKMKLDRKKGVWTKSVSLKPSGSYQFRYFVDGRDWRNDDQADRYVANEYASENGVIDV
jgi:1,4-alpha-glucan branching enzyme